MRLRPKGKDLDEGMNFAGEKPTTGGIPEAPMDGKEYDRKNGQWVEATKTSPTSDGKSTIMTNQKLPKLITFITDDGRKGELDLGQVFINNNVPLCGCIVTNVAGTDPTRILTWEEIKNFSDNHGFEYGSHTVDVTINLTKKENGDPYTLDEIDYQMKESKRVLEEKLGKPCNYFVYPQGVDNPDMHRIARKYYKTSIDIDGGINRQPVCMHPLWRENADGETIETLKALVDDLYNGDHGWLVFMVHTTFDRNGDYSIYDTLLKYIATKEIPVVTVSKALEYYENPVDVGEFDKTNKNVYGWGSATEDDFFMVDPTGKLFSNLLRMPTIYNFGGADISINKSPADYKIQTITYENITDAQGASDGFPTDKGGTLITIIPEHRAYAIQQFYPIRGGFYSRATNGSTTNWSPFVSYIDIHRSPSGINMDSVPADFASGMTTFGAQMGSYGYGTVECRKYLTDGYAYQTFKPSGSSHIFTRRSKGSSWDKWYRTSQNMTLTTTERNALNPTDTQIGDMVFDKTLNKPIWRNNTNLGWVDSTGASV